MIVHPKKKNKYIEKIKLREREAKNLILIYMSIKKLWIKPKII